MRRVDSAVVDQRYASWAIVLRLLWLRYLGLLGVGTFGGGLREGNLHWEPSA
jgi:hypothetical protein